MDKDIPRLPEFGFGQSCGVAERMDDAVAEGGTEFWYLAATPGGEETLLPPDLAPNRGEGVSEGGPLLAVPGGRCNAQASVTAEAVGQQGHDREQAEQAGGGAGDGLVGPLPKAGSRGHRPGRLGVS